MTHILISPSRQEAGKESGAPAGNATAMAGMSGGHSHGAPKAGHSGGHGSNGGGMEGMEEMGIMTTNFAWDLKSKDAMDAKAAKEKADAAKKAGTAPAPVAPKAGAPAPAMDSMAKGMGGHSHS